MNQKKKEKTKKKKKMHINIVTANACLSISPPFRFNGAFARAAHFAEALYGNISQPELIDVICMQELIVNRKQVLNSLAHHPYHTEIDYGSLIGNNIRFLESGLTIASKWPIVTQRNHVFSGPTYHVEAFMAKSVQYAKIKINSSYFVHILNTHTQAWSNPKAKKIRIEQFKQIAQFITFLQIPKNEPLILCGDFNFDFFEHSMKLLEVMNIVKCTMHLPEQPQFSFDPTINTLVGTDDASEYITRTNQQGCYDEFINTGICSCCARQLIDGIATRNNKLKVSCATTNVIKNVAKNEFEIYINISTKRQTRNVSDHFAVYSQLKFDENEEYNDDEDNDDQNEKKLDEDEHYWKWFTFEFVIFIVCYASLTFLLLFLTRKK